MAFYAVILIIIITLSLSCMAVTFMISTNNLRKEYQKGWEDAKKLYYTDVINEKREEEQRRANALAKENATPIPISSELLMAYGVNTVGGLPKSVREAYNISDEQNSLDIDALMNMERDKEV